MLKALFSLLLLLAIVNTGFGHPMAPGLLRVDQLQDEQYKVFWKVPLQKRSDLRAQPHLPESCVQASDITQGVEGTGQLLSWTSRCPSNLTGLVFTISDLDDKSPGVLLRIHMSDGRFFHQMLSPEQNSFTVPATKSISEIVKNYVVLGVEHLLSGIDHVLFVLLLFLLVGWNSRLFWTITLFTLGHSVTLALTVLGYVSFPVMLVESLIAFSIVITAAEWLRNKPNTLFKRFPWLISGGFGLLHGMGFAGVLSEIGLPQNEVPLALASFNIGIELGQLFVICCAYALLKGFMAIRTNWPSWLRVLPGYIVGGIAAMWFWQRSGLL
jgi:hydrogenase/urease accessory protein HupE